MAKEFFDVFPTFLGLHQVEELQGQPLAGTSASGDKRIDYVLKYYDLAVKVGKRFNLNPIVILAQAAIESGWGTSTLAVKFNNFFGITAYGAKNDYWKGEKYISKSSGLPFRVYANAEAGFADFARLITSKYKEAAKASGSYTEYARLIANSPYISEKNGDNRAKYKELIIRNAVAIITIAKAKKLNSL